MNCPNCNSEMSERMIAEVMIDECDNCGVLWFDKGELNVYRKRYYKIEIDKDVLFNQFKKFKEIEGCNCPKCSSDKFIITKKDENVFGRCAECKGVFFSKGTIERFISRYETLESIGNGLFVHDMGRGAFSIIEMSWDILGGD